MKNVFRKILSVQILLLSCNAGFAQIHRLDSIKVEFEGFYTETVFNVNCDAFDNTFLNTKKSKIIYNSRDLSTFESLKKNFKQTRERSFDVRGKVTYHYGKRSVKYCFDVFAYFYKDGKLYYNKKLLIAISNNFYSGYPRYLDSLRNHE